MHASFRAQKSKTHRCRRTGADALWAGLTALPVHGSALLLPVLSIWPAWPKGGLKSFPDTLDGAPPRATTPVGKFSEPVQDLVGPEPLEAMQRLVQRRELLVRNAADLLD